MASDLERIKTGVRDEGGLKVYEMGVIRDAFGIQRLRGSNVETKIKPGLDHENLGYLPEKLPTEQEQLVRIYDKGSDLGKVISAVLHPSPAGDSLLLRIATDQTQPADVLDEIWKIINTYKTDE